MTFKLHAVKTIVAGGIFFLLPVILIGFLLRKALNFAEGLSGPLVNLIGVRAIGGIGMRTLVAIALLILVCFVAGLLARTRLGRAAFTAAETSVLGVFPQWRIARGLVSGLDPAAGADIEVVLVPTGAGWCLAFFLEQPTGDWWPVFIPGAPRWTSGQLSFAHSDRVHPTGLSAAQAILLLRRFGAGSEDVETLLASLREKKAL